MTPVEGLKWFARGDSMVAGSLAVLLSVELGITLFRARGLVGFAISRGDLGYSGSVPVGGSPGVCWLSSLRPCRPEDIIEYFRALDAELRLRLGPPIEGYTIDDLAGLT